MSDWQGAANKSNKKVQSHVAKKYKGVASIGAIDPITPPTLRDGAIAPPTKSGMPDVGIEAEPKAGPGWRGALRKTPAKQGDIERPQQSDTVKT